MRLFVWCHWRPPEVPKVLWHFSHRRPLEPPPRRPCPLAASRAARPGRRLLARAGTLLALLRAQTVMLGPLRWVEEGVTRVVQVLGLLGGLSLPSRIDLVWVVELNKGSVGGLDNGVARTRRHLELLVVARGGSRRSSTEKFDHGGLVEHVVLQEARGAVNAGRTAVHTGTGRDLLAGCLDDLVQDAVEPVRESHPADMPVEDECGPRDGVKDRVPIQISPVAQDQQRGERPDQMLETV